MSAFRDQLRESLLLRLFAGAVLAVAVSGGFTLYLSRGPVAEAVQRRAELRVAGYARNRVFPMLRRQGISAAKDAAEAAQNELDVWRLRLWDREGRLLYPRAEAGVDRPPALRAALAGSRESRVRPRSSDGTRPAFLDVFVPADARGGPVAVAELRYAYGQQQGLVAEMRGLLFLAVGVGVAAAVLGLVSLQASVWRELRSERDQAAYRANRDPVTGLFNEGRFEEDLEQELARAMRDGTGGVLVLLEIHNFASLTERLGRIGGEEAIARVGELVGEQLRGTDTAGRLEGPRFAILARGVRHETHEETVTSRLLGRLTDTLRVAGQEARIEVSGGAARYPEDASERKTLLSCAEAALYAAREKGGGCVVDYADVGEEGALTRVARVREALAADRLRLEAQPIVDLETREPVEYELLLRMVDEEGESRSMGPYLEAAKDAGLQPRIDGWVLKAVAQCLRADGSAAGTRFVINLGAETLDDDGFLELAQAILAEEAVDASRLSFEIAESAIAHDPQPAFQLIESLERYGCGFTLDDFGAGFESAEQLEQLPFDRIKIDSRFIRNLPQHPISQHLVKAFAETGRTLGKEMIAQFVEDEATAAILCRFEIRLAQGYHLGRPQTLDRVIGETG